MEDGGGEISTQFHSSTRRYSFFVFCWFFFSALFVEDSVFSSMCTFGIFVQKKWLKLCGPISRFSLSTHWSPCLLFVPTPCYFGVAFGNHALPREVTSKVSAFQCSLLLHEGSLLFSVTQYFLPKSRGHKGRTHRNYLQDNKGDAVLQEQHLPQLSRLPVGGSVS